jgi:hypothetical protein
MTGIGLFSINGLKTESNNKSAPPDMVFVMGSAPHITVMAQFVNGAPLWRDNQYYLERGAVQGFNQFRSWRGNARNYSTMPQEKNSF